METHTHICNIVFKDYDDVLNVEQVSILLGLSNKTVYRLLRIGEIESKRIGHIFRIPKVNVMKYLGIFDFPIYEQATV